MKDIIFIDIAEILLCALVFCFALYASIELIRNKLNIYMTVYCILSMLLSLSWSYVIFYNILNTDWYNPNRLIDLIVTLTIIQTMILLLYSLITIIVYIVNRKIIIK